MDYKNFHNYKVNLINYFRIIKFYEIIYAAKISRKQRSKLLLENEINSKILSNNSINIIKEEKQINFRKLSFEIWPEIHQFVSSILLTNIFSIKGCNVNNGGCEQGCTEIQSRVHCYCHSGFVLNRDQRTCSQASSVSCSENNGGCEQDCITKGNGDITCKCGKGFVLADDNKTCYDIDECSRGQKCRPESTCVNTVGGYNVH
ncbi:Growth arrest-specific protein 6 [Armadillidium nasatum]|uniref:Growth arrest-specific protein 6 n=1 Tax=Armadillidium nasatum TaxID=96803 RepID=A0A5N5T759_9CRUS|nr:Growth arrest-specific protein 6 [Armadillidium nasatum]